MTHRSSLSHTRWLRLLPFSLTLSLNVASAGCQPSLPSPLPDPASAASPATEPHAVLEPDSPLDSAPRVLRVHLIPSPGASVDTSRVLFVRGHVGKAHLRQVEEEDVSQALSERVLPTLIWPEGETGVLAPLLALEPGETYGILSASPPLAVDLHVRAEDSVPFVPRVWPPPDSADPAAFAIFCGDSPVLSTPASLSLAPGATPALWNPGVLVHLAPNCLRLDASIHTGASGNDPSGDSDSTAGAGSDPSGDSNSSAGSGGGPGTDPSGDSDSTAASEGAILIGSMAFDPASVVLPPPLLSLADGSSLRLDPLPLARASAPAPPQESPAPCDAEEVRFGPACARVADDRLFVSTPEFPLFWSVRTEATGHFTRVTGASEPWALKGLLPSQTVTFDITTVDLSGASAASSASVITSPPMPHVVISEVLANPQGAEPDQEWVELFNDGLVPADLEGYVLSDVGGETVLPAAALVPGAYALIVNEPFLEDDELDPVPATDTLVVRVPSLGKGGLKNDGEPLKLLTPQGDIASRFPAAPKPKPGESVTRLDVSSPSSSAGAFKVGPPTPGAAN